MKSVIINYICVALLLCLVYQIIPNKSLIIKDMYLFVGLGLIIYFIYKRISVEQFETESDAPASLPAQVLTDREILNHVQNVIKNIDNATNLANILKALESSAPGPKRDALIKIFNMTKTNPVMIGRVVLTTPQKIVEIADLIGKNPEIKNLLKTKKNSKKQTELINKLENKLQKLESIITGLNVDGTVPEFLQKMMAKNKYVDRDGMVRDAMYGDMKYHQGNPEQLQPVIRRDDDEWDTTGYSIMNPDRWKPVDPTIRDVYQENQCPVCPNMTSGYPVNVMEFDKSRYVIGSDNISIDYIKKLNEKKI